MKKFYLYFRFKTENGGLLYTRMAPLRPSADFPYVGAQKDTYGLRFA